MHQLEANRPQRPYPISDVAARRFPLTSSASIFQNAVDPVMTLELENGLELPGPNVEATMQFEHYNPYGEIMVSIDPPPSNFQVDLGLPFPYPFPLIYPPPPPLLDIITATNVDPTTNKTSTCLPGSAQIRICATRNCNAILPSLGPRNVCKRCHVAGTANASATTNSQSNSSIPDASPTPFGSSNNQNLSSSSSSSSDSILTLTCTATSDTSTSDTSTPVFASQMAGKKRPRTSPKPELNDEQEQYEERSTRVHALSLPSPSLAGIPTAFIPLAVCPTTTTSITTAPQACGRPTGTRPIPLPPPRSAMNPSRPTNQGDSAGKPVLPTSLPPTRSRSSLCRSATAATTTTKRTPTQPTSQIPRPTRRVISVPTATTSPHKHYNVTSGSSATFASASSVSTVVVNTPITGSCTTPGCSNPVSGSSPSHSSSSSSPPLYIRRCMKCVKADWDTRKGDVERCILARNGRTRVDERVESRHASGPAPVSSAGGDKLEAKSTATLPPAPLPLPISEELVPKPLESKPKPLGSGLKPLEPGPKPLEPVPKPILEPEISPESVPATATTTTTLEPKHNLNPSPNSKLILRFPASLWHNAKPFRYCSNILCTRRLEEGYNKITCLTCRARDRGKGRVLLEVIQIGALSLVDWDKWEGADWPGDDGELLLKPVSGARLCAGRWCSHIIPPQEEYRWDMCFACRGSFINEKRRQAGLDLHKSSTVLQLDVLAYKSNGVKKDIDRQERRGRAIIAEEVAAEDEERCASLDCGMFVVTWRGKSGVMGAVGRPAGASSLCLQCTWRKAREVEREERLCMGREKAKRKSKGRDAVPCVREKDIVDLGAEQAMDVELTATESDPASLSMKTRYPEYISLSSLSAHFRTQLYAFLQDQVSLAIRRRTSTSPSVTPIPTASMPTPHLQPTTTTTALFTFNGQFSTVTTTPDITNPRSKPTVLRHIAHVRTELERVSCLRLRPSNSEEPLVSFSRGLAARFVCIHSIPLAMFVPTGRLNSSTATQAQAVEGRADANMEELNDWAAIIKKDIKGELDVVTVVDNSHHLIPGKMTVIRFRMGVVDVA